MLYASRDFQQKYKSQIDLKLQQQQSLWDGSLQRDPQEHCVCVPDQQGKKEHVKGEVAAEKLHLSIVFSTSNPDRLAQALHSLKNKTIPRLFLSIKCHFRYQLERCKSLQKGRSKRAAQSHLLCYPSVTAELLELLVGEFCFFLS